MNRTLNQALHIVACCMQYVAMASALGILHTTLSGLPTVRVFEDFAQSIVIRTWRVASLRELRHCVPCDGEEIYKKFDIFKIIPIFVMLIHHENIKKSHRLHCYKLLPQQVDKPLFSMGNLIMYKNIQIGILENEEWKDIKLDSKYSYQVSSFGRVRLIKKNYCCIKIQRIGNHNHPLISIRHSPTSIKRFLTHRLIAMAFIPNPENKRTVNHINGIKHDNCILNLEWATDSEQAIHRHYVLNKQSTIKATEIGRLKKQIAVLQFDKNNNLIKEHDSLFLAGRSIGKKHQCISLVCKGVYKYAYGFIWKYKI